MRAQSRRRRPSQKLLTLHRTRLFYFLCLGLLWCFRFVYFCEVLHHDIDTGTWCTRVVNIVSLLSSVFAMLLYLDDCIGTLGWYEIPIFVFAESHDVVQLEVVTHFIVLLDAVQCPVLTTITKSIYLQAFWTQVVTGTAKNLCQNTPV